MRRPALGDIWPRPDRDLDDVAVAAVRVLSAGGRITTRVHAVAKKHGVDPYLFRLLLLFIETNRPLTIGNVAELLGVSHSTASRVATRAHAAGLVDKFGNPIDGREVAVRITVPGRSAATRCLDALRSDDLRELTDLPAYGCPVPNRNWGWRAGVRAGMPDE